MSGHRKPQLTIRRLQQAAAEFARVESDHVETSLYGVTDGKAVGTYVEHKFRDWLAQRFQFDSGNSAAGIDFPSLNVDMKVTSLRQPQSSCPFKSARQKVFGLGYSLLILVYDKSDDPERRTGRLDFKHVVFIDAGRTADHQMTRGIADILQRDGNIDDILAYFQDRNLPVDDVEAQQLAEQILKTPPAIGYLTISNALQWRLQYTRVISVAGQVDGVDRVR